MTTRKLVVVGTVVAALAAAAPAGAINDPRVPANECSGNPVAVGDTPSPPNPGIDRVTFVNPPVSDDNPGHGDGAQAVNHTQALFHC
jgi:hypothetical protein